MRVVVVSIFRQLKGRAHERLEDLIDLLGKDEEEEEVVGCAALCVEAIAADFLSRALRDGAPAGKRKRGGRILRGTVRALRAHQLLEDDSPRAIVSSFGALLLGVVQAIEDDAITEFVQVGMVEDARALSNRLQPFVHTSPDNCFGGSGSANIAPPLTELLATFK